MGIKERQEKEREFKKKDIIDAAEKVFFAKGFNNATMDDVAREAEFSKRTVYVYFRSKDQLYFEIMFRGFRLLNGLYEKAVETAPDVAGMEKLKLIGRTFIHFNECFPQHFKAIMDYENKEMDFDTRDPYIKECYEEGEKLLAAMKTSLKEAIEMGEARAEIDVVNASLFMWSSIMGVLSLTKGKEKYLMKYHGRKSEELLDEALKFIIRSIEK
jgi:AcrR family transcriptional regulator